MFSREPTFFGSLSFAVLPTKQGGAMFLFKLEWVTHAPRVFGKLGYVSHSQTNPFSREGENGRRGPHMALRCWVELGCSQVHSSSSLRREFKENSSEIFLAAIVSCLCIVVLVSFVSEGNPSNCRVNIKVPDMHISYSIKKEFIFVLVIEK